jgi:hypothetical protein
MIFVIFVADGQLAIENFARADARRPSLLARKELLPTFPGVRGKSGRASETGGLSAQSPP